MERIRKKKRWKNGLSITPFITQKKDAGDVEKGIDNFNSMMGSSDSGGGATMMEGAMKDLYMDVQELGKDNYLRRQKQKLKTRENKLYSTTKPKELKNLIDEVEELEAKISVVENSDKHQVTDQEIKELKNQIYLLKRQLHNDIDKELYDWRPYVERKIARLEAKLKSYGLKENKMEFKHLCERVNKSIIDNHKIIDRGDNWLVDNKFEIVKDGTIYWDGDYVGKDSYELPDEKEIDKLIAQGIIDSRDEVYELDLERADFPQWVFELKDALIKSKKVNEDLNNVTEVEDKAKEVMDPTFASAVREIRSHDKGREELKKVRKAPKEGEEVLPKDLKLKLDESLFTEIYTPKYVIKHKRK